jgi:hypothetical protein
MIPDTTMAAMMPVFQTQVRDISINQIKGPHSIRRSLCLDMMQVSIVAVVEEEATSINPTKHRLTRYRRHRRYRKAHVAAEVQKTRHNKEELTGMQHVK